MSDTPSPIDRARVLRKKMTDEEKVLWQQLRAKRFYRIKFLRQHPIIYDVVNNKQKYFTPDFYCAEKKVIIEVDGKIHQFSKKRDRQRDEILTSLGYKILRIRNEEFINLQDVLKKIKIFIFDSP